MPCGDKKAYADALMNIYRMPEEQRLCMGEKGRKMIREKYDYSLLAKKYIEIFSDCMDK